MDKPQWNEVFQLTIKLFLKTTRSTQLITDYVKNVGGVINVHLDKEIMSHAENARIRYRAYLDEETAKKKEKEGAGKRKLVQNEIDDLKRRKVNLDKDVQSLTKAADETAERAEATGKVEYIIHSNAMRRSAKQKTGEISKLEDEIKVKSTKL